MRRYCRVYQDDIAIFYTAKEDQFITSLCDAEKVCKYTWCLGKDGYFVTWINNKMHKLQHFIFGKYKGLFIDHINGNKSDNRRCNLRTANYSQNSWNSNIPKNNSSGFKGVKYEKRRNYWVATIWYKYRPIYLGAYSNKESAALRYNEAAKELFGKYACLNPIGNTEGYRICKGGI